MEKSTGPGSDLTAALGLPSEPGPVTSLPHVLISFLFQQVSLPTKSAPQTRGCLAIQLIQYPPPLGMNWAYLYPKQMVSDHISGKGGKRKIRHIALFQDNSSLRGGNGCSVIFVCPISESAQLTCSVRKAQLSSLQLPEQNFSKLINTIYNSNRKMARKGKQNTRQQVLGLNKKFHQPPRSQ